MFQITTGIYQKICQIAMPDIAVKAAQNAIEDANIKPEDIDLLLLATVTPDYFTPSCACVVQGAIGAVNAAAFDINAACSSFITCLVTADQFIKTGMYKNILISNLCACLHDTITHVCHVCHRSTILLFLPLTIPDTPQASDFPIPHS